MKKILIAIPIIILLSFPLFAFSAQQTWTNGEALSSVRTKISANDTDLYAQAATKWLTGTAYTADNQIVVYNGMIYICKTSHTAGTFATDLAAARWALWGAATYQPLMGTDDNYVTDAEKTRLGNLEATDNVTFGNVTASGGTLSAGVANTTQGALVLYTNTDPIYSFGITPAASPSAIVSLKAPPAMPGGSNYLLNFDADGTGGWTDPASLGGGCTNLTSFIAQTANSVFYSDASGDVKEVTVGANGTYFRSNGPGSAPTFDTPSGAAHDAVTIGATPNGLSLATQVLSLAAASTSSAGAAPAATAPAAGLYNYLGITNGETVYTNKALFDATSPSTQAIGDSASVGTATAAARRDHKHAMPSYTTLAASLDGENWTFTGAVDMSGASSVLMGPISFEGATANDYETTFSITDPTADRTITVLDVNTTIPAATSVDASGNILISGIADSTSEPLGIGTVELGHASDTTIARSGAGEITVEGIPLTKTVASGSVELNTTTVAASGVIASGACQVLGTAATATGALSASDGVDWYFVGSPVAKTGFSPSANGMLTLIPYVSANDAVQIATCNNTAASITLNTSGNGATIKWAVRR